MSSIPAPQHRTVAYTEWLLAPTGDAAVLQAALEAAAADPARGDLPVWYRSVQTQNGPALVVGYNAETIA